MIERIVRRGKGVTEVPKVTGFYGPRDSEGYRHFRVVRIRSYEAKREIEDDPEVEMKRVMAGDGGQGGHQGKIHQVAQNDRQQSLEKIDEH